MVPFLLGLAVSVSTDPGGGFPPHDPVASSRLAQSLILTGVFLLAAGPFGAYYGRRRYKDFPHRRLLNAAVLLLFASIAAGGIFLLNAGLTRMYTQDRHIKIGNVVQGRGEFEALVRRIEASVPEDASISYSEPMWDPGTGAEVVVPVLIESERDAQPIRAAVEFFDKPHPLSESIVHYLFTKYHALPIQKVVIVSKSGYTPAARRRAEMNKLVPLSMPQAERHDWAKILPPDREERPAAPRPLPGAP